MVRRSILAVVCCAVLFSSTQAAANRTPPLRIGVAAMVSPKQTIFVYRRVLAYLAEEIKRPIEMVQRRSYAEMDDLLRDKNVMVAMICSGPYVTNHEELGVEILAAPVMYGKPFYHAYVIAQKNSPIRKLEDLKGKVFAFTDPKSNTGKLVPTYMLAKRGHTPASFFSKFIFSGHHSESIKQVAEGKVDGASVDHLIWEYANATNPRYTNKTKVVAKSPAYGMPPIVVHPKIDKALKKRLKTALLNMHKSPAGKKVLAKIFIDRFVEVPDKNYDSVRQMQTWLKGRKAK
jgi:phosphonate transport system substrate-binding protein